VEAIHRGGDVGGDDRNNTREQVSRTMSCQFCIAFLASGDAFDFYFKICGLYL